MKEIERIGVSLEKELLSRFDKLIEKQGYQNRSEAIRDLVRRKITEDELDKPKAKAVAIVYLVYDHHETKLMQKLTVLQHSHLLTTICTMHIHLNEHDCMEIIILKGKVSEIQKMADGILSHKGVKLGKTSFITSHCP